MQRYPQFRHLPPRIVLVPVMLILELLLLGVAWILAFARPRWAWKISHWAMRTLPNRSWYR